MGSEMCIRDRLCVQLLTYKLVCHSNVVIAGNMDQHGGAIELEWWGKTLCDRILELSGSVEM